MVHTHLDKILSKMQKCANISNKCQFDTMSLTHSIQHWGCDICNIKRIVQDPEAPCGEITTPHSEQPRFHRTPEGHPAWPR